MSTATFPLLDRLPARGEHLSGDEIFSRFLDYVTSKGLSLYPAQEDALLEILAGRNVILATPTGSGKSLVATAMLFKALCEGKRAVYTCPIKALVSEKFFALCQDFGPESVGMLTGDAAINRDASILCCTAEILASMCLREGHWAAADFVVMDEFHYYSDKERGVAWQIPLLVLSSATFLLMSATLGDVSFFEKSLTQLTDRPTATIRAKERPVPLTFEYRETPLHETVAEYVEKARAPIYLVNFTQRACAEEAQNLMSVDYCTKDEKRTIAEALKDTSFDSPYGKEVQKFLKHGLGLHHAGLLPKYRLTVEKLAQQGLLKIILGTDTLGVGVNIPIRTVLFTKLCKFDGEKTAILAVRDFQQIAGRAGRKGFDSIGFVAAQAPEHVIENMRLEQKAGGDAAKLRKMVKKKPPEKGYVHWDKVTFERLIGAQPEALQSRFRVSHSMVLAVLQRTDNLHDGARALRRLINASHGTAVDRRQRMKMAWEMFKSLIEAKVVTRSPPEGEGWSYVIDRGLQLDFNIHNTLAMWLLDTLPKLDKESEEYALNVVTLVESVLENPDVILFKQLDAIKREAIGEMKAAGMEYEERMAELEKLEYPKPHREFIYETFNEFARIHPWVAAENIRPKSIGREMFEHYASFSNYIKEYELERSEGILLRYLSDLYKTLIQTVPASARSPELLEIIGFFRTSLREVDSSLVDEWERLHGVDEDGVPTTAKPEAEKVDEGAADITRNPRAFTAMLRQSVFRVVRALANRDWLTAVKLLDPSDEGERWTADTLSAALGPFFEAHGRMRVDHAARAPANTRVIPETDARWRIEQILLDDEDENDGLLTFVVDVSKSRELGRPWVWLVSVGD